jgi:predicted nucleic acid-binding protein
MAKILLDTTYLFPLAGINVRGVEREAIERASAIGHHLSISEMSLFELAAKGAKLVDDGSADAERLAQAVRSIVSDETLGKVRLYEEGILPIAIALRRHNSDFIDCVILASAVLTSEILVTEDELLLRSSEMIKLARKTNPKFLICSFKHLSRTP